LSYLPSNLHAPAQIFSESPEEKQARRLAVAALLRRRRLCAGLTFRQVAFATMKDASHISRLEQGWSFPSSKMAEDILGAIARLEAEGAGNPERAAQARAEYEALDAEAVGSPR
jgi:transcriptional regulator with XRE-family HTH domain